MDAADPEKNQEREQLPCPDDLPISQTLDM